MLPTIKKAFDKGSKPVLKIKFSMPSGQRTALNIFDGIAKVQLTDEAQRRSWTFTKLSILNPARANCNPPEKIAGSRMTRTPYDQP
jgi:hypothetical protein